MITVIAGIIMLGILVFIHELGHFCVAKMAGVKVLKFSLGFGPRLVSRQWGETEYLICAIPLGGYVQMLGEGAGENGESVPLTEEERKRSFADKPVMHRTAIIAAGPAMNLVLPFIILPLAFMLGVNIPSYLEEASCVGYVLPGSQAERAGFVAGDCITAISGDEVPTWHEANLTLIAHAGSVLNVDVSRGEGALQLQFEPEDGGIEGLQSLGLFPRQEAVVGAVSPGMPAKASGVEVGDRIVSIAGSPVDSWYDLKRVIQGGRGEPQEFVLDRGGKELTFTIKPLKQDDQDAFLIGIAPLQETVFKRFSFIEAVRAGADRTMDLINLTVLFVQKLFAGHVPTKSIGGPITVVQIAGQAAQTDLASIFSVLAFLSIQLGILNLLPIPILDGGHLFFNMFEIILRRPLSLRTREFLQQVGLLLILALMILAFYNDIVRLFVGGQ